MWKLIKNKNAATIIFVVILMTVFLGFVALVVDLGYMFTVKSKLQNAADAAALAGAGDICNYEVISERLANENGVDPSNVKIRVGKFDRDENPIFSPDRNPPNAVEVGINENHDTFFGRILGINNVDIGVKAVATTTGPRCCPVKYIIPIAIHENYIPKDLCKGVDEGQEIITTQQILDYLNLEGGGKICVGDWIEEGTYEIVNKGDEGILVVFDLIEEKKYGVAGLLACLRKDIIAHLVPPTKKKYHVAGLLAVKITDIKTYRTHYDQIFKAKLIEWKKPDIDFHPSVPFNPTLPGPPKLVK